jgi:hypothetical protein
MHIRIKEILKKDQYKSPSRMNNHTISKKAKSNISGLSNIHNETK